MWVCGHSRDGIAGSNPATGQGSLSLVSVVRCQVEVCASGRSLIKSSPAECAIAHDNNPIKLKRSDRKKSD